MIPRQLAGKLRSIARGFPVISLTGPRQSGKTTLVRNVFSNYTYLNLENLDTMSAAKEDPRRFLRPHKGTGMIIDEAQRVPELFSYLQGIVDDSGLMGRYILTGSQNFLLMEKITQSLAGRTAVLHLMPFTASELEAQDLLLHDLDEVLFTGMYPPVFYRPISPTEFYPAYIETYVERDVRSLKNIGDLNLFRKFVLLCAGRVGQLLNLTSLGNEVGIDHKTVGSWLSVLETSFVVFQLRPYHRNWSKRIVKQPKLYFYDTGLLCSLLGLRRVSDLSSHHLRGSIYESYVIAEYIKRQYHAGDRPAAYFWRDHSGHEVDLIIEDGLNVLAVEIKAGETLNDELFSGLRWFCDHTDVSPAGCSLVYGGETPQERAAAKVLPWNIAHTLGNTG